MERGFASLIEVASSNMPDFNEAKARKAMAIMSAVYRKHGMPQEYLSHNIGTAELVARLNLGEDLIYAGILHNAMHFEPDNPEITREFGEGVAKLLAEKNRFVLATEGKKISAGKFELVRALFFSATKNIGLTVLQLADKTDELRRVDDLIRIGVKSESYKQELIELAGNVYIPLAFKLGIYLIKDECEDRVFEYTQVKDYEKLYAKISEQRAERMKDSMEFVRALERKLADDEMDVKIYVREKRISSIYNKMQRKNVPLNQIYDIYAARVITNSVKQCYEVLGIVHGLGKPMLEEFDDYIAKPKPNGYQSLHTTIIMHDNRPLEIQIRTKEMHDVSESGVAAHWRYKGSEPSEKADRKLTWLKELIRWQSEAKVNSGPAAVDFFENRIYALTPKGEVIELPENSTALDFAYAVHSDLGNKCNKIKANDRIVPLSYKVENADTVQVITSQQQRPKAHWLTFVVTEKARTKIRQELNIVPVKRAGIQKTSYAVKTSDARIRFGKCCTPVLGDDIVGFRTSKRKISVHRQDCPEIDKMERESAVGVEWANQKGKDYIAEIKVIARDRAGLLGDVLSVFSANKANVVSANARTTIGNLTNCIFEVRAQNIEQLQKIMENAKAVEGVKSVTRN